MAMMDDDDADDHSSHNMVQHLTAMKRRGKLRGKSKSHVEGKVKKHRGGKGKAKVEKVMHEFKEGELHSGSKSGPQVTSRKQAIAIALSEQRKANK